MTLFSTSDIAHFIKPHFEKDHNEKTQDNQRTHDFVSVELGPNLNFGIHPICPEFNRSLGPLIEDIWPSGKPFKHFDL